MSSSLASKIKMAAIFLFSRFGTQFFAFEPPMYVSFKGNYQYWPNMVLTMIYIGKTCPGLFSPPHDSQRFHTPWPIGLTFFLSGLD